LTEIELTRRLSELANRNLAPADHPIFLGAGAYDHYVPAAIDQLLLRSEFYTAYTPYQAEISQGIFAVHLRIPVADMPIDRHGSGQTLPCTMAAALWPRLAV